MSEIENNMKKCIYCAELIQEAAIKCRYCHEWLVEDKDNHFSKYVSQTNKFVSEKITDLNQEGSGNVFVPTKNKPLKIRHISFYSDKLSVGEEIRCYDNIVIIYCDARVKVKNFITNRKLDFKLAFENKQLKGKPGYIELIPIAANDGNRLLGGSLNDKEFEQLNLVHNIIAAVSFNNRLYFYTDDLIEKGYFKYGDYEFNANGDIGKSGKVIANLTEEVQKKNIYFGSEWQGFKWSEENPFEFSISSGSTVRVKFLGMESGIKLKTNTYVNHDVFKSLIEYYVLNERFPIF